MSTGHIKLTLRSPYTFTEIRFVEYECGHIDVLSVEDADGVEIETVLLSGEENMREAVLGASVFFLQLARNCDQLLEMFDEYAPESVDSTETVVTDKVDAETQN